MTSLIDALKELDPVAEMQFCNWFLHSIYDESVDPDLIQILITSVFPHEERRTLGTAGTGVQKI
jgi:hypothetical protein